MLCSPDFFFSFRDTSYNFSSVEIQPNPSIQEISIVLRNGSSGIPDKIYDIKKIIESIPKGYPNLNLLEIKDIYFMGVYGMEYVSSYSTLHGQALQFVTKLFMKTEALLSIFNNFLYRK
uniref:Uncharacterized protein n=1 Tax=Acrobeloides nanus TaxID=290746 RepID=A0A914DLV3_9BILA